MDPAWHTEYSYCESHLVRSWPAKGRRSSSVCGAAAVALAATGGARFSLDNALGWADNLSGLWWGVGALLASAIVALAMLTAGRRPETPAVVDTEEDRHLRAA